MGDFRYPQFCPFARAAEILAPRWALLVLRNLAFGPQRFSDLKAGLRGISTSTLTQRLEELSGHGVIRQRDLPPPAPATVYELTAAGQALQPVMQELGRFGTRFMEPPEPGDQIEAAWARMALVLFKRWEPSPEVGIRLRILDPGGSAEIAVTVRGSDDGTSVENLAEEPVDAELRLGPSALMSTLLGHFDVRDAIAEGSIQLEGDAEAAARLPELFDLDRRRLGLVSTETEAPEPPSQ